RAAAASASCRLCSIANCVLRNCSCTSKYERNASGAPDTAFSWLFVPFMAGGLAPGVSASTVLAPSPVTSNAANTAKKVLQPMFFIVPLTLGLNRRKLRQKCKRKHHQTVGPPLPHCVPH